MLKLAVTLALVALTCALDLDAEWGQYKVKFTKNYASVEEESIRY